MLKVPRGLVSTSPILSARADAQGTVVRVGGSGVKSVNLKRDPGRPSRNRLIPSFLRLEDRTTPSLFAGSSQLNTLPITSSEGDKVVAVSASAANGRSVAVWTQPSLGGKGDIFIQVFDENRAKDGGPKQITNSYFDESSPSVDMDDQGRFVVAWVRTYANGNDGVFAQRMYANGAVSGSTFPVSATFFHESQPNVAMAPNGNFVIAFTIDTINNLDVLARKYPARFDGSASFEGAVTGNLTIASSGVLNESAASGAFANDGFYAVAFHSEKDVLVRRYNSPVTTGATTTIGTSIIANSTEIEENPNLAMAADKSVVVAWQSRESQTTDAIISVKARTLSSGWALSAPVTINAGSRTGVPGDQTVVQYSRPVVAINALDKSFVVVSELRQSVSEPLHFASKAAISVVEMNANLTVRLRGEILEQQFEGSTIASTSAINRTIRPGISLSGTKFYSVLYVTYDQADLTDFGQPTLRRKSGFLA